MGKIAARYCDKIVLTDEDPFDEDPEAIIEEIADGIKEVPENRQYKKILDRKKAIEEAVKMAQKNDVVIITGKGSEPYMRVKKGEKIPWNEREIVLDILRKLKIEI
jgi:UDP-N-acetylmuramoyl-L-alanyl-D-glutamate--2,6-diaminopimelate ligase